MTDNWKRRRWKPIPEFNGYFISDLGEVKNASGLILKQQESWAGYMLIGLKGKTRTIASLVLSAFRGNRPNGDHAAHLNGIRNDNRLSNLAWVTQAENELHKKIHGTHLIGEKANGVKLNESQVLEIRSKYKRFYKYRSNIREISREYGISVSNIRSIVNRETWTHI